MLRSSCLPVALVLALAPTAGAATLTVGPNGQHATIGDALAVAANGDVIEVEPGDYAETLTIDNLAVEIVGTGGSGATSISGADTNQIVLTGGAQVALTGFELIGNSDRGIDMNGSDLVATDLRVTGFDVSGFGVDGGGIQCTDGSLEVHDSTFDGNTAEDGGHLRFEACDGLILNSTFLGGTSTDDGGAIRADAGTVIIQDSWFEQNSAGGQAGAIHFNDFGTLEVSNTTFLDNDAGDLGGAIKAGQSDFGAADTDLLFDNCTFSGNNTLGSLGGALYHRGNGDLTVRNSVFDDNIAGVNGGAIRFFPDGSVVGTFENNLFLANVAGDIGGGIAADQPGGYGGGGSSTLVASGNDFRGNDSTRGGGLSVEAFDDVTVVGNTFCSNNAYSSGGGLRVTATGDNSALFTNNVFIENTSGGFGGGISAFDTGGGFGPDHEFSNNTLVGNDGVDGGNVYLNNVGADFQNNIFAFALGGGGMYSNQGPAGVLDYNLWFDNQPDDTTGVLGAGDLGANAVFADPLLVAYQADGVCGNDLLTLDVGSPAIDAGNPDPAYDDPDGSQNDIGAYGGPSANPDAGTDADGDGWPAIADCDDDDPNVNPDAQEVCDGIDNNCDSLIDDASAPGATDWFPDRDADGFGDDAAVVTACDAPPGHIATGGDCDDGDDAINPSGVETCDGVDENCDGSIDEGLTSTWYADSDGDGFGDAGDATDTCDGAPAGTVADDTDCNDANAAVYPGAEEICDDLDNNCDGAVDEGLTTTWYRDVDSDGFGDDEKAQDDCVQPSGFVPEGGDCDDANPQVNPGATDSSADGVDNDCDGEDGRASANEDLVAISGCACSQGSAPAGGLWLGLVGLVLGLRRRSR